MQSVELNIRRIGDEGYAPLPRDLAERLGLQSGDEVHARIEGNRLVLEKTTPDLN
ncbi:MAG: AbrB/MazE/SpoVT family DNA-binding domain-containing protein [Planctomycetes bacterium]|nr:AbrB/MazE/SpoVT family DNA-binding domain-containing protein [Planctomycetota bacterium]MCW8136633.1 AbrB/MazE/SpoVT family DNA-binding domain-containing protein [Planctomycetota bacterium]